MAEPNMITLQGLHDLQAELEQLEGEGRREIAERIKTAREWGDLKENSEYHDAKNDQAHLETKIARLRERIAAAEIVEASEERDVVSFGSTVIVEERSGDRRSWTIVGSREAAPSEGRISAESPVARALLGLRAGELARVSLPRGESELIVLEVQGG